MPLGGKRCTCDSTAKDEKEEKRREAHRLVDGMEATQGGEGQVQRVGLKMATKEEKDMPEEGKSEETVMQTSRREQDWRKWRQVRDGCVIILSICQE